MGENGAPRGAEPDSGPTRPGRDGHADSMTAKRAGGRDQLLHHAVRLSIMCVVWGTISGAWSLTSGLLAGSLGVIGLGLMVVGDVVGSAALVWRFRAEQHDALRANRAESRVSLVVASALLVAAMVLTVEAIYALSVRSGPSDSWVAMLSAGAAAVVLTPLGLAKYQVARALRSHALRGDAILSCIGAALGVLALLGLAADSLLGWWWADRVAALVVAVVAAAAGVQVLRNRPQSALAILEREDSSLVKQ